MLMEMFPGLPCRLALKLGVDCSTRTFGNPSPGMAQGVVPDIQIEESFADYARGIDDAYEAVKNYRS